MTGRPAFVRVRNWERYQHYKTGPKSEVARKKAGMSPLPWLSLHTSILTDPLIMQMSEHARLLWFYVLVMARLTFNEVPTDLAFLSRTLNMNKRHVSDGLAELLQSERVEALSVPASRQLAVGYPVASLYDRHEGHEGHEENMSTGGPSAPLALVPFDQFWSTYPRREKRDRAERAWGKIGVTPEMWETEIKPGLERWRTSRQWAIDEVIPHPASWLNDRRWTEEPRQAEAGAATGGDMLGGWK